MAIIASCNQPDESQLIEFQDVDNFWSAYDKIKAEADTSRHLAILQEEFLDKASDGQNMLLEVRNYSPEEYIHSINSYPKFYTALRDNLTNKEEIKKDILKSLNNFKKLYPLKKQGKIYMGVGNFRTPGTTVDSIVLFGSEMAFTSSDMDMSEFSDRYDYFRDYITENPIANIEFLSAHEFVHTQQIEAMGTNLLSVALREGSAEFIAEMVSDRKSTIPAMKYGRENKQEVMDQFTKEMFNTRLSYWVWSSRENQFGHSDLGYYVGYEISQFYYNNSEDKDKAIADLIDLDYSDIEAVKAFIDKVNYFDESTNALLDGYKKTQPQVLSVDRQGNLFTVHFSEVMDDNYREFNYGPLGAEGVLRISEYIGFSEDKKSLSFRAEVKENTKQQIEFSEQFRSKEGVEMVPYLYELK